MRLQVNNMSIQNYALRQLLDAEKARVVNVHNDMKKLFNLLQDSKYEKKLINEVSLSINLFIINKMI